MNNKQLTIKHKQQQYYDLRDALGNALDKKLGELENALTGDFLTMSSLANEQVVASLRADWAAAQVALKTYEERFGLYGDKGTSAFNNVTADYSQQIETLLGDTKIAAKEKEKQYFDLTNQLLEGLENALTELKMSSNAE